MICAWIDTSSAETGSSAMISSGRTARARAMPMRCRWPPLNSWGYRRACARIQAHRFEQFGHAVTRFHPRAQSVHGQWFPEQGADGHAGVEGAVGVLEHDLHLAPQPPEIALLQVEDRVRPARFPFFKGRMERGRSGGGIDQAQDRPSDRGLPAPAFAHQAQRFAPFQGQVDPVDGLDGRPVAPQQSAAHGEVFLQSPDLQ